MIRPLLLLGFVLRLALCVAQQPSVFDNWRVEDGLPNNRVSAVLQSRDGFLWCGTNGGVAKFDGLRFTSFDIARAPALKSNRVVALCEDDERLWIGAEGGNVSYYEAGKIFSYSPKEFPRHVETSITKMQFVPGYGVFISTSNTGLLWITADKKLRVITSKDGLHSDNVRGVALFRDTLRICDLKGLSMLVNNRVLASPSVRGSSLIERYLDMEVDAVHDQLLFAAYSLKDGREALFALSRDGWKKIKVRCTHNGLHPAELPPQWRLKKDSRSNIYLNGVLGSIKLNVSDSEIVDDFMSPEGATTSEVLSSMQDKEGNVWIGTEKNGLFRLKPNPFSYLDFFDDVAGNSVHSVCQDDQGNLWWTSEHGELTRYNGGHITREAPNLHSRLWTAHAYKDTLFFGGVTGGLQYKVKGKYFTELLFGGSQWIRALLHRHDTLFIGTYNELLIRTRGRISHFPGNTVTDNLRINRFFIDDQDRFWVLSDADVFQLKGDKMISLSKKVGIPLLHVRSALQLTDSIYLFGTYGNGMVVKNGNALTYLTTANGLFDNTISDILRIGPQLWLTGDKGLTKLVYDDVVAFAQGRLSFIQATLYDKSDGLVVSEFNGGSQSTYVPLGQNRFGFASINGIAVIDFDKIPHNNTVPPVEIESVSTDDRRVDLASAIVLPYEENNLEITYTALSFTSPRNNQFRYKLEGYDKAWRNAGTERKAVYTHLPPGKYTFTVLARNNDGVWNDIGRSVSIEIVPPFYLTTWFRVVLFLSIVGAIAVLVWMIAKNIQEKEQLNVMVEREKQQARLHAVLETEEAERKRIAQDLHDGIGPLISTVKLNLSLIAERTPAVEMITTSQQQIDSIAAELRNITYNLVPATLGAFGLVAAVREFVARLNKEVPVSIYFENIGEPSLSKPTEVILFRVIQEVINNSIKHSGSNEVTVQLIHDGELFRIMIEDTGTGFDMTTAFQKNRSRGLKNIKDRCQAIGAIVDIDSRPGRGTTVTIEMHNDKS